MRSGTVAGSVLWLLLVALGAAAFGQSGQPDAGDRTSGPASASTQAGGGIEAEGGGFSVTHHELNIRGERIAYTATAGHLPLTDDAGKPQEFVRCTVAQMCKVGSDEPRSGGMAFPAGGRRHRRSPPGPEGLAAPPVDA